MKKITRCLMFLLMILLTLTFTACGKTDETNVSFEMTLPQIKSLYKVAIESEEAYNVKLKEISPEANCTRDQFLNAYDKFKNHVIAYVPSSFRYIQYELMFVFAGNEVCISENNFQEANVDMVWQEFTRGTDACRAFGTFYSSSAPDPIYDEPMRKMIADGKLCDVFSSSIEMDASDYYSLQKNRNGYRIKDAYIYETAEYNLYYFYVYHENGTYVGSLEFKAYKNEEGKIPAFYWSDFGHFSFITLEEYMQK